MSTKFYTIDADESGKMDHERVSGQKKQDRGTHEDKLEPKNTQEKLLELLTGLSVCMHRMEASQKQQYEKDVKGKKSSLFCSIFRHCRDMSRKALDLTPSPKASLQV